MVRSDKFEKECVACKYGDTTDYCPETDCSKCPNRIQEGEAAWPEAMCHCLETPDESEETCKYYENIEGKEENLRLNKFKEQCRTCVFSCGCGYCQQTRCVMCRLYIPENESNNPEVVCRCSETSDEGETSCKYYRKVEE